MYTDLYTRVATAKDVVANNNVTYSDVIDLGVARDVGAGEDIYCVITVSASFANTTSCYFQVGYSADSTPSTFYPISQSYRFNNGDLVAGTVVTMRINPITAVGAFTGQEMPITGRRYLAARLVTEAVSPTTQSGKFTVDFVHGMQGVKQFYTAGFSFVAGA